MTRTLLLLICGLSLPSVVSAQDVRRLFISVDMEGIAGVLQGPVTLEVRFKHYQPAQLLALLPGVERPDAHAIRYVGPDIIAISRFLTVLNGYSLDLEP